MSYIGEKFSEVKNETTAQISKRIRQDIKEAIRAGTLPPITCSVRTSHYGAVSICIKETPFQVNNPERFKPENANKNGFQMPFHTEKAEATLKQIQKIANQYNRDNSDVSSDYYDTNFYCSVSFEFDIKEREKLAYESGVDLYCVEPKAEAAPVELAEATSVELAEAAPDSLSGDEGIVIHHSAQQGTIIKGDTYKYRAIIKEFRFKWSRNCQFWYVPSTRGSALPSKNLDHVAAKLRSAGAVVRIEFIEASEAEAHAAKVAALLERADYARRGAERAEDRSAVASAKIDHIMDMIPLGQPILVGHHSERRHRSDIEKMRRNMDKLCEEQKLAKHLSAKGASLENYAARLTPEAINAQRDAKGTVAEVAKLLHKRIKHDVKGITWARQTAKGTGSRPWIHFGVRFAEERFMRVCVYGGRIAVERNWGALKSISTEGQSPRETYDLIVNELCAPIA